MSVKLVLHEIRIRKRSLSFFENTFPIENFMQIKAEIEKYKK